VGIGVVKARTHKNTYLITGSKGFAIMQKQKVVKAVSVEFNVIMSNLSNDE
jgi:hypothetical protein